MQRRNSYDKSPSRLRKVRSFLFWSTGALAGLIAQLASMPYFWYVTLYPLMFQYILWSGFKQDVPWYVDVVAGAILHRYHLAAVFAICLVLRHCDYTVPLFKSVKAALGY